MRIIKIFIFTAMLMILWTFPVMAEVIYLDMPPVDLSLQGFGTPVQIETESGWTDEDTTNQLVFTLLSIVDWGQTRTIATETKIVDYVVLTGLNDPTFIIKQREVPAHEEMNPILGKHPSLQIVDIYFPVMISGNYLIAREIKSRPWRNIWQTLSRSLEVYCVTGNISLGIKVKFP